MNKYVPTTEDVHGIQARQEAEQQGATKALQDFKKFVIRVLPKGLVNRASLIADLDESMKRLDETGHLLMGPLHRADRIEQEDNVGQI